MSWDLARGEEFLPDTSLSELKRLMQAETKTKPRLRLLIAVHRKKGESLDAIAEACGVPRRTVHGTIKRFQDRGAAAAHAVKQEGRPPHLSLKQRKQLVRELEHGPLHNRQGLWTTKEVRELIRKKFGIAYVPQHTWRILKACGFSLLRPRPRHHKAASRQQSERFKKKARCIAKKFRRKGFVVACEDEATFGLLPTTARGWTRKGSQPFMVLNNKREYTNAFGARSKRAFVYAFAKRKTQRDFVKFAGKLIAQWNRVLLFADNGPCHKGKSVKEFLRKHRNTFRLEYFPAYTPELNPIEQCWKPARRTLSNRFLRSLPAAQYHLRKVFDNPKSMPRMFHYLRD